MEPRNWIGLTIAFIGMVLQPIGWILYPWVRILSLVLFAVGVAIFFTQKYIEQMDAKEFGSGSDPSSSGPGDIYNYSGWRSGGRSESGLSDSDGGSGD